MSEEGDRYEDYEKYSDHLPGGRFTPARHKSSVKDSTETEEDRERREYEKMKWYRHEMRIDDDDDPVLKRIHDETKSMFEAQKRKWG
jgi:hypothetical protein